MQLLLSAWTLGRGHGSRQDVCIHTAACACERNQPVIQPYVLLFPPQSYDDGDDWEAREAERRKQAELLQQQQQALAGRRKCWDGCRGVGCSGCNAIRLCFAVITAARSVAKQQQPGLAARYSLLAAAGS
jgi:hypothetical protein